jgi:hypothetical protein
LGEGPVRLIAEADDDPGKGNYGCGVFVSLRDDIEVVEHGCSIDGSNSYMIYVPTDNIAIIVLSNVSGDAPDKMRMHTA